jgi:hypothetical protein
MNVRAEMGEGLSFFIVNTGKPTTILIMMPNEKV